MSFEKTNLPLERSAFFFQELSAPRQTSSTERRFIHVPVSSLLTESEEKYPKGMYVAAVLLGFIPTPHLCCPAAQASMLLLTKCQRSRQFWKSGQLLCLILNCSNYPIAQQETHSDTRRLPLGVRYTFCVVRTEQWGTFSFFELLIL